MQPKKVYDISATRMTHVQLSEEPPRQLIRVDEQNQHVAGYLLVELDRHGRICGIEYDENHLPLSER